jgi:hypothetical protein
MPVRQALNNQQKGGSAMGTKKSFVLIMAGCILLVWLPVNTVIFHGYIGRASILVKIFYWGLPITSCLLAIAALLMPGPLSDLFKAERRWSFFVFLSMSLGLLLWSLVLPCEYDIKIMTIIGSSVPIIVSLVMLIAIYQEKLKQCFLKKG